MRCPTSTTSKTQNWWEIWRQSPCFTMAHHGFPFILRGKSSATPADSCRWRTSCRSWKRCGRQLSLWFDPYTADDWIWLVLFPRFEAWRWEKYHGHVAANRDAIRKIVENWDFTEAKKGETKASNSRDFSRWKNRPWFSADFWNESSDRCCLGMSQYLWCSCGSCPQVVGILK